MPILHWLNDEEARKTSSRVPYRLLEADGALSYGDPNTENMLIQGDNLEALKALLPYYAGQVKCIYIDPPFNTQQAFENYDDNLEHSIWLSTIYPRLEILWDLLSSDGTIFVHIDDNELGYLILILDEIFGRKNRVSTITFKQGAPTGHKAINPGMVTTINYIVAYGKSKANWSPNKLFIGRERDDRYSQYIENYDDDYSSWRTIPLSKAFAEFHGKTAKVLKQELGEEYETELNEFVIKNSSRVIRTARPNYEGVGSNVREVIDESKKQPDKVMFLHRDAFNDMYFKNGERWLFYSDKVKDIDGIKIAGEPLTNLWDDLLSNNLHNEGSISFPKGKKPESLLKRIFELTTVSNDLVLDSFLGSGTTAAVAHKMGRRYIGIEMGEHAVTHCVPRLQKVIDGEQGGISKSVNWQGGGGFHFYRLGETIFNEEGQINPAVKFRPLAAHVWFTETHIPLDLTPIPSPKGRWGLTPLLGIHNGTAYYLLYNGILGEKSKDGGNVLTGKVLANLPPHHGPKVIYGELTTFGSQRLTRENIVFKQVPYDIKAR
jgi:adenine-specific DNA-methyltransferase